MRKNNTLTSGELYRLARFIETCNKPFDGWKHIEKEASVAMDRPITRSNIETAAGNCGVELDSLVNVSETNSPFTNMMACVRDLERRVNELEKLVGSCK